MEGTRASHETGAVMIQTVSKNSPYLAHRLLNSFCTKNSSPLSLAATIAPNFGWSWNCVCRWYHLEGHTLRPVRAGAYLIFVTKNGKIWSFSTFPNTSLLSAVYRYTIFISYVKMFFIGMRKGLLWVKLGELKKSALKIHWRKNMTNIRYVVGTISVCDVGGR